MVERQFVPKQALGPQPQCLVNLLNQRYRHAAVPVIHDVKQFFLGGNSILVRIQCGVSFGREAGLSDQGLR